MIVFDLMCGDGHTFEQWFSSSADYDAQAREHALRCPECGGTEVAKALSAPRVNGGAAPAAAPCGLPACGTGGCGLAGG
jgi:hypothetical protein